MPDRQLGRDPLHIHANQFQLHLQLFFQRIFRQTYHLQNLLWLGHSVSESVVVSCNIIFTAGETTLKSLTLEAASIWRREETRVAGRLVQLNPTLQKDKVLDESESGSWVQLIPSPPKKSKYLPLKFRYSPEEEVREYQGKVIPNNDCHHPDHHCKCVGHYGFLHINININIHNICLFSWSW